jgi:hypothetical protein
MTSPIISSAAPVTSSAKAPARLTLTIMRGGPTNVAASVFLYDLFAAQRVGDQRLGRAWCGLCAHVQHA